MTCLHVFILLKLQLVRVEPRSYLSNGIAHVTFQLLSITNALPMNTRRILNASSGARVTCAARGRPVCASLGSPPSSFPSGCRVTSSAAAG